MLGLKRRRSILLLLVPGSPAIRRPVPQSLQQLQKKLPVVQAWIADTLARHAADAQPVSALGFPRLGSYYPRALLDEVRAIFVPLIPVPPLAQLGLAGFEDFERLEVAGITYRNSYFVRDDHAELESLHFHELVHVVQWQHLGAERFVLAYAVGHLLGRYEKNPLETMAYSLQARFEQEASAFAVAPIVRRDLDVIVPQLFEIAARQIG